MPSRIYWLNRLHNAITIVCLTVFLIKFFYKKNCYINLIKLFNDFSFQMDLQSRAPENILEEERKLNGTFWLKSTLNKRKYKCIKKNYWKMVKTKRKFSIVRFGHCVLFAWPANIVEKSKCFFGSKSLNVPVVSKAIFFVHQVFQTNSLQYAKICVR